MARHPRDPLQPPTEPSPQLRLALISKLLDNTPMPATCPPLPATVREAARELLAVPEDLLSAHTGLLPDW